MISRRILLGALVIAVLTAAPVRVFAICYGINLHVLTSTNSNPASGTVTVTITGNANNGTYVVNGWRPGPNWGPGGFVNVGGSFQCLGPTVSFSGPRLYGTWSISGHASDGSWYVYGQATLGGQCLACDGGAPPPGYCDMYLDSADNGYHGTGLATICSAVQVPPMCNVGHQVTLKYNGVIVGRDMTPSQSPVGYVSRICVDQSAAQNGDLYELDVDGVAVAQGAVSLRNAGSPEHPLWSFAASVGGSVNCGSGGGGTPPPTPTPYGSATPPPAPVAAGTPPSVVAYHPPGAPGSTIYGQSVLVGNPQDIYGPITDRLDRVLDTSGLGEPIIQDADLSQRGHLDDLQGKMDGIADTVNNAVTDTTSHMSSIASGITSSWSSASFGSVSTFDLPLSLFHAGFPVSIAVPEFASTIRNVILWVLVGCWYWLAARSIMALTPAK